MTNQKITLEQSTRFSQSLLWKYQRDYFENKGINAWAQGEVPYYITSNALIAYCYAQIAWRYLQDSIKNNFIDFNQPLYMFELGVGSGKFSYLFLSRLREFLAQAKLLGKLKICYVMTDFTENNIQFWEQHPQFKPFLEEGILDFALYRIGELQDLHLKHQNIVLKAHSCKNPILAVGNYIFDTVPHDAFRFSNGKLEESLTTIQTDSDNIVNDVVVSLNKLDTTFTFHEVNLPYYNNPALDNILAYYQQNYKQGNLLVPIGAISSIDTLRALSDDRIFIISGDKGYTSLESMEGLGTPHIAFHGSFSMMVNFDFIGRYIKNLGGDALLAEDYAGMKISLFSLGQKFSNLAETAWANDQFNWHFSTKEFLLIKNKILDDVNNLDLEQTLALLKLSYWDADIFMAVVSRLASIANQATAPYARALRRGLAAIDANYYFIKNNKNVPFELARIYQLIGASEEAAICYQKSLDYFGTSSATYFNLGLCLYHSQKMEEAKSYFQKALELDGNNTAAKKWLNYLKEQQV